MDLGNARAWTRELWDKLSLEGAFVIDATVGNGYDTVYLAGKVGETGREYGFDVQMEAIGATRARLNEAGLLDR